MRLKSKGLGRKELVLDFREYAVVREGSEVVIKGTIREPIVWDFSIRVCEDDLAGIARLAGDRKVLGLVLRAILKRRPLHHWSVERAEQAVRAARRRAEAEAKFGARVAAGRADAQPLAGGS